MEIEAIQDYVGDEDCFSQGTHSIPNQYFKCLETGIEMIFTFRIGSGWSVGSPTGISVIPLLHYSRTTGRKIPFPKSPEKYKKHQKEFYDSLNKLKAVL